MRMTVTSISLANALVFFLALYNTNATVVIESSNHKEYKYESQPAFFGRRFVPNVKYQGRLQLIESDPYLCGGARDPDPDNENESTTRVFTNSGRRRTSLSSRMFPWGAQRRANVPAGVNYEPAKVIVPPDGSSVALLAKRGTCSFETKARTAMASLPKNTVKWVIVYDNEQNTRLSPMSANDPRGVKVGLLLISKASGNDIVVKLTSQPTSSIEEGGLLVTMDSNSPWGPSFYDDPDGWIAVTLSGVIIFTMLFGCLLMCCQAGYIRREGNVIIFGNPQMSVQDYRSRLLTEDQVMALPQVEYFCVDSLKPSAETRSNTTNEQGIAEQTADSSKAKLKNISTAVNSDVSPSLGQNDYFENIMCSVCLEEYEAGEKLRLLPCKHSFHTDCILPWLTERSPMCPLCKCDVYHEIVRRNDTSCASSLSSSPDVERPDGRTRQIESPDDLLQVATDEVQDSMDDNGVDSSSTGFDSAASFGTLQSVREANWLLSSLFGVRSEQISRGDENGDDSLTSPLLERHD